MTLGLEIPNITFIIAIAVGGYVWLRYRKRPLSRTPPIVSLTRDERTNNPLEGLERQIKQHGPVIGLRRDGRVLTDDATFSFELGTAKILKIEFVPRMFDNSIFQDIDSVINRLLTKHLNTMIRRAELLKYHPEGPANLLPHLQRTVAEAVMSMVFGDARTYLYLTCHSAEAKCHLKEILSPLDRDIVIDTAEGVAELIGTFRSRSLLARHVPAVWQIVTWLKVVIYTVMIRFGIAFGPLVWNQISAILQQSNEKPPKDDVRLLSNDD
ncbi:hypothetical protein BDV41DRAFT_579375 [Aspergillus transmontanensis]|uniref:Cytochrome P450 n=1 Tax=Aspergillus transmontanensis TaxID=1034304 RepID=A0A5N6VRY6_9EURO|nr:hypothetical protein BDV41DRAFT_579375 [Aspergillus transmontanensis]